MCTVCKLVRSTDQSHLPGQWSSLAIFSFPSPAAAAAAAAAVSHCGPWSITSHPPTQRRVCTRRRRRRLFTRNRTRRWLATEQNKALDMSTDSKLIQIGRSNNPPTDALPHTLRRHVTPTYWFGRQGQYGVGGGRGLARKGTRAEWPPAGRSLRRLPYFPECGSFGDSYAGWEATGWAYLIRGLPYFFFFNKKNFFLNFKMAAVSGFFFIQGWWVIGWGWCEN